MLNNLGSTLQNIGTQITTTLPGVINKTIGIKNAGSAAANAVSQRAQDNQFAFNSAEAAINRDYNTAMWEEQKNFNSAEAAKNREFQAAEAEKTRQWQEHLANTAYQRAVEDLKKAGLNPILAYMNGATTPSGATASGSSASASLASGTAASGSNYTGQASNISDMLALMGAIGTSLGTALEAYGMAAGNQAQSFAETMAGIYNDIRGYKNKGTYNKPQTTNPHNNYQYNHENHEYGFYHHAF